MRHSLLLGVSALTLGATGAGAQTTVIPSPPTPVDQAVPAGQPVPTSAIEQSAQANAHDSGLADIIVTATKVETTLQKTPQAIQTIDGGTLARQGVSSAQQLNKLVGGLQIESNGSASSIFIRGVGSRVLTTSSDPAIAFSVDGVYYARPLGTSATLFDLSRVEVVKGPQGTLYGRNATGGAVNVITNHPQLGVRSMDGEIEVGDYQSVRTMVGVNLPIGDNLAIRLAGQTLYHKGYLSDGYDDADTKSARASLYYKPSDRFSLYISGDYAHQGGQGPGAVPVGPGADNNALTTRFVVPGAPYTGPSDPRINAFLHAATPATAIPLPFPGTYCIGVPLNGLSVAGSPAVLTCGNPLGAASNQANGYEDNDFYGANVTANLDVGIGNLTAVGGYRGSKVNSLFSVDASPQFNTDRINQFTGELRLASKPNVGRLKWLIGGFYLHEKQDAVTINSLNNSGISNPIATPGSALPATACLGPFDPDGPGPASAVPGICLANAVAQSAFQVVDPDIVNATEAAFGQATYSLADWARLTGGIRYTHEDKSETNGVITSIYSVPAGVDVSFPSEGSVKYNNVSYRAGAEVDIAPRSMVYATYSTAFHAGGFNFGVRDGPNQYEYKPEKVKSYVVGVKNRFLDNRLQINVEGFWLDYNNYQQNNFGRVNDGSLACSQLMIAMSCPLTLRTENAATARVRGVEGDIVLAPMRNTTLNVNILYNDAKFTNFSLPDAFGGPPAVYDGRRIPGSVPWTVTGGINQAFPLANGARIVADIRTQFKSSAYLWFTDAPGDYQKGYTRTDISLTYETPQGHLSLTGFVRNVENKVTLLQGSPTDTTTGAVWTNLNPPRTFGAILGFHF